MRGRESRLYLLYQGLSGERHFYYRNNWVSNTRKAVSIVFFSQ